MRVIKGEYITINPTGTVEVGFSVDGILTSKVLGDYSALSTYADPVISDEAAFLLLMASWMGVDPTLGDQTKFTQYNVEVDFSALQAIRRVLPA